jgi:hypothetical protein
MTDIAVRPVGSDIAAQARTMPEQDIVAWIDTEGSRWLDEAETIDQILSVRDGASGIWWVTRARGAKDAAQKSKILQLRAERKAGSWLDEHVRPGNPQLSQDAIIRTLPDGITLSESSRWQLIARLSQELFDEWVDECLAIGKEITAAGLYRLATNAERRDMISKFPMDDIEVTKGMVLAIIDSAIDTGDASWLLSEQCCYYFDTMDIPYGAVKAWADTGCESIEDILKKKIRGQ